MSDLVAFLRARLDEDEAAAKEAGVRGASWGSVKLDPEELGDAWWMHPPFELHVRRHDPARVLREVEAKRAILDRYEDALMRGDDPMYSGAAEYIQQQEYEDWTLPALAAVYRDHPDYDEAWKP